ncbi:MAG: response regulator [Candidatus Kapabacteria bacterium]|nr:response regulator [Candidatus Kapabacteria bacterium]MBX7156345.1 response regulator [Bacteroidota bacterium]
MKKILLIDDSEYIIEGTASLLRFEDYDVITANNGATGVKMAIEHHPDLIICDVSMPEMDGFAVLKEIRNNKETESMRFMFLTARADKSDMRTGMEIGADDYLIKPFTVEELLSAIEAQWKKTESIQRGFEEIKMNVTYALPHEFRTALNQIIGSATYVKSSAFSSDPEAIVELADDILASAHRLLKITENFLVYAQLETISGDLQARQGLLQYYSEEAASMIGDIVLSKFSTSGRLDDLVMNNSVEGISLAISSENLHKIFDEITDNALKFSESGTKIYVDVVNSEKELYVTIADQGRGMSAAQLAGIGAYKQFERMVYEQQGVGLGLIIAKRLVELHNGNFIISSQEGQGTVVQIALPVSSKV